MIALLEKLNIDGTLLTITARSVDRQWAEYQLTARAEELTSYLWRVCQVRGIYHYVRDRAYPGGVGGPFLGPDDWTELLPDAERWLRRHPAGLNAAPLEER